MKKLFKVMAIITSGYDGEVSQYNSGYIITELEPVDDEDVTIDDVREADVPYIEVNRYECMGEITEDEILTLSKFGIVSV